MVLRRSPLPSGDVVATLLSPAGKWRAVARKGKLPGGNLARLSLFHDVTVQYWRRREEDLALITQVQLNGALAGLTRPEAYPYAHLMADLADALTVDQPVGERLYALVASGLRGVHAHVDPEAVALAYAWKMLTATGFHPQVASCRPEAGGSCALPPSYLIVGEGTARCAQHADEALGSNIRGPDALGDHGAEARQLFLGEAAMAELHLLCHGSLTEAVKQPPHDRQRHWRALLRYVRWHVGQVRSLEALC